MAPAISAVPAICKDGSPACISIEFTVTPLHDQSGTSGIAAIMRDATKRFEEMK